MIYLHGFASSPQSSKARYFTEKFAAIGRTVQTPDLTEGDFEHTTLSQQLAFLDKSMGDQPAILMGSSMGGYLAALFAARYLALSMELYEYDERGTYKHNNVHARFRKP